VKKAASLISPSWKGELNGAGKWWEERNWQKILFLHVPRKKNWAALEIGCGMGRLMRQLSPKFKRIYGVDISEQMIRFSKKYLRGLKNTETRLGSGYDLAGFKDNSCNFVYSIITFQHIQDAGIVRNYLEEVYRVLKPHGYFVIQVHTSENFVRARPANARWNRYTPVTFEGNNYRRDEIVKFLQKAGLSLIAAEEGLIHENWIWVTAQKSA